MTTFTEADVRRLLDPAELITALETAFRDRYPHARIPARTHVQLPDGVFLVMACFDDSRGALGMKLIVVQNNLGSAAERVQATYMLLDPSAGRPSLTIEANYLTDIRTAATSALASKFLARKDARVLGIFGTGRQARAHLKVMPLVGNFERVLVCGSNPESARRFAEEMSRKTLPVDAANAATCAAESDVICTCTTSSMPLFDGRLLRPGTHLNLVGAFQPHTREVDSATVQHARVFVDTYDGALAEAGDLLIPISEGVIACNHIVGDLHELTCGNKTARKPAGDITIFKSVGCALEDLVAAELLSRRERLIPS